MDTARKATGTSMRSLFTLLAGLVLLMPAVAAAADGRDGTCLRDGAVTNVGCVIPDEVSPAPIPQAGRPTSQVDVPDRPKWLTDDEKRAWLEKRQRSLDRRVLEVQRARFIARARGESEAEIEQLNDSFGALQARRRQNLRELRAATPAN